MHRAIPGKEEEKTEANARFLQHGTNLVVCQCDLSSDLRQDTDLKHNFKTTRYAS